MIITEERTHTLANMKRINSTCSVRYCGNFLALDNQRCGLRYGFLALLRHSALSELSGIGEKGPHILTPLPGIQFAPSSAPETIRDK